MQEKQIPLQVVCSEGRSKKANDERLRSFGIPALLLQEVQILAFDKTGIQI